ncbi:N-acetylmuramoyl-L-alanine amidase [Merismopedia glauca]|uniref:N-acetylmuramoyl-L-alanine amidase n=1 Tax=Merismopedia glauca CCAP 1448/3 TaxID=1296344 RepID=A0A2T1BZY7_9CYAN|nr:peptidoglycan recognition family protein [Merismopedia glauca]PSB01585.1 N-acetylmuramoyl-L-alanine amidase [Merismopedia glauca CCAP 1448/3]
MFDRIRLVLVATTLVLGAIACTTPSPPISQQTLTSPSLQPSANQTPAPQTPSVRVQIIDRPIKFTEQRKKLTLEYIRLHYDPKATDISIDPRTIVIHWTDTPSLSATFNTFDPELLAGRPELIKGGAVNVSAQFVIDRDGKIYRLMPETRLARHVIGLNHTAIGIENVGAEKFPLTPQQLTANTNLVRYLVQKYPKIRFLIGHYEYQKFRGSSLWKELLPGYITYKSDPSPDFMKKLRAKLNDLNLCQEPKCQ